MKLMRSIGCYSIAALVLLTGCESSQPTNRAPRNAQSIRLASDDVRVVFSAGVEVMRGEFNRVRPRPSDRVVLIEPELYQTRSESGTARDYYGGVSEMRRKAWFQVDPIGSATRARIRVDLERLDTRRRELLRPPISRLDDNPGYTPIQEDAATTSEQNTLWTSAGRDRALERRLLLELRERVEGPAPTLDAGPSRTPEPGQDTRSPTPASAPADPGPIAEPSSSTGTLYPVD